MTTSVDVREQLVEALELNLVGPKPGHPFEGEELWRKEEPSRWYLTGYLLPKSAPAELKEDPEADDSLDVAVASDGGQTDDNPEPERAPAKKAQMSSSLGISVILSAATKQLRVTVLWGDYSLQPSKQPEHKDREVWKRVQRQEELQVPVPDEGMASHVIPNSEGVKIYVRACALTGSVSDHDQALLGARSVSVFLVNERDLASASRREERIIYQATLRLALVSVTDDAREGFLSRPNLRGLYADEFDERIADLHYRNVCEFAVGHGVSTTARTDSCGRCVEVASTWFPRAEVAKFVPSKVNDVELSMEALGALASSAEAESKLGALPTLYAQWIAAQSSQTYKSPERTSVAEELLRRCEAAKRRISQGIAALADPQVFAAFKIANRAMAAAQRRGDAQKRGIKPDAASAPHWFPFQLAFLLMNLVGLADGAHPDRDVADLLFFPTGGGKTEAYLGLTAFSLVLRRLRDPSIRSAGLTVLMRYTLRLLTLDQLSRAATLICALENERKKSVESLGEWPFEIGLWVGRKATPTRMGKKGDNDSHSARKRTLDYLRDPKHNPSPIPLEACPWCGLPFSSKSFGLIPNPDDPIDLRITCLNSAAECDFVGNTPLPIVTVDEPLYRRLPCMIIATVDKFASLPWLAAAGKLFGNVTHYDAAGFYGPGERPTATPLPEGLSPPVLIIQDELHLISGPLGTMVGLYETAVEQLCAREKNGKRVIPKIVASTATVRRAESQVRALFQRTQVEVFPPPGPNREDSFFAHVASGPSTPARLYLGIAAQGRALKVVLLRTYLTLLSAAQRQYELAGGARFAGKNPADPYMTVLGYFSALRELGGSRRIVEDEVRSRLHGYAQHLRVGEVGATLSNRSIHAEVVELTSRESTSKVASTKERLKKPFSEDDRVDVALATNMISVGLDITRLGLMVVLGQPKTTAEYIQATSRVGRDEKRPGLVITLLNVHRPRDRSHYERFAAYHHSFYRAVEATTVTPFSPRAVDRGLAAVVVALVRHGEMAQSANSPQGKERFPMTPATRSGEIEKYRVALNWVQALVAERARSHNLELSTAEAQELALSMAQQVENLFDQWVKIANYYKKDNVGLQYNASEYHRGTKPFKPLLHDPLDPELSNLPVMFKRFKAQWSLREVEAEVPVMIKKLDQEESE